MVIVTPLLAFAVTVLILVEITVIAIAWLAEAVDA